MSRIADWFIDTLNGFGFITQQPDQQLPDGEPVVTARQRGLPILSWTVRSASERAPYWDMPES